MTTRLTRRARRALFCASIVAALAAGLALGLGPFNPTPSLSVVPTAHASEQLYSCGMHPNVVQDQPGTCPICGMDLTPVGAKQAGSAAGSITVDPVMVQNMGVRVAKVERSSLRRRVRTIGEIDVAEDQVSVVNLRFSGWIEKIYADQTGQAVRRGQALFSIYSPELVSAQKEYLIAYNTSGKDSELAKSAAERVRLWDIPQAVLDQVAQQQNVNRTLMVRAPRSGYVLHKDVVEGARIVAGTDLYRIGNLKTIWVNAEVYEFDAPWIETGHEATMELSYQKGRKFSGKVNYIHPTLNKNSRTLKVRLEFKNPGIELKPGMFATVWIEAQHKDDTLVIPTEAIIRTGERQLVFVTHQLGKFEPREIITGLVGNGHRTEVLSGLSAGETVVTSGQFLLDSESQLQEALAKLGAARLQIQPKTAAEARHDRTRGASPQTGAGDTETSWTCAMHPQIVQDAPGECPVCGMSLVEQKK
jgi:RND family efflux transporter MFP subunit